MQLTALNEISRDVTYSKSIASKLGLAIVKDQILTNFNAYRQK